ncbi:hypothetical protein PGQ11_013459 [Apiospora arundinis]|uniref:Uncharacterized protein n=1 Tax=Apiospora arundinis TaxID=335852 RepID=A0ABR2HPF8_9PEZI
MDVFPPLHLPMWRGGHDAFVVDDEAGISLMRDQDALMPLYDVLAPRTSPYTKSKGHETLPLFSPVLLKRAHGSNSRRSKIPILGTKIPPARRNIQYHQVSTKSLNTTETAKYTQQQSRTVIKQQQQLVAGTMIPSRRSSSASFTAAKRLARNNSTKSNKGKGAASQYPQLRTPPLTRTPTPTSKKTLSSGGRYSPARPRPSKTLSAELEDDLRVLVFDVGDGAFNGEPTLIVGNPDTNCHAVFWAKPDRTEFVFHHGRMKERADPTSTLETTNYDKECGCMVRGENETSTFHIPPRLDEYRLELILGIGRGGIKMEPKLAAMVVMKLFLGMEVPEVLRMESTSSAASSSSTFSSPRFSSSPSSYSEKSESQ